MPLERAQVRAEQDRVRLAGERGAKESVVDARQDAADAGGRRERPERRPGRDHADGHHRAPLVQALERPDGNLLEQEHVGPVAREPHHLLEKRPALRRNGVPVKQIPAADEERQARG
jgi:hypothetical protein